MTTTEMLKIQLNDSYAMLKKFAEVCPEELWRANNHGLPLWNHVIHTLMGTAFWLRADYSREFDSGFHLPEKLRDKLQRDEWCTSEDGFMTKAEINACIAVLDQSLEAFWKTVDDSILDVKIWGKITYLSAISAQIRHIMCHVGMCNAALIENDFDEVEWVAYGE